MKLGYIYDPVTKEVQDTAVIKQGVAMSSGTKMELCCILNGKGLNNHGKVLHCTFRQTEAATGLHRSKF
jgi:hypothetical protein